jgi:hypothetical protein
MSMSKAKIKSDLCILQKTGGVILAELRIVNDKLYVYLADVYFWWRAASRKEGYLEDEYQKNGLTYKETVDYGINLRPLVILVFGVGKVSSYNQGVYSRVLNKLHEEYENHPESYKRYRIAKLANFIDSSGGVKKLAGYVVEKSKVDELVEKGDSDTVEVTTLNKVVNANEDKALRRKV